MNTGGNKEVEVVDKKSTKKIRENCSAENALNRYQPHKSNEVTFLPDKAAVRQSIINIYSIIKACKGFEVEL